MTRKEINSRLANAILQRDQAQKMLKEHFNELETRNEETRWVRMLLVKKAEVEYWQRRKADDE